MKIFTLFLFLLNTFNFSNANKEELHLRNYLFRNYDKNIRPVNKYNNTLPIEIGIAIQNLESFNQIEETIDINLWFRKSWYDNNLKWNSSISNITFLSLNIDEVWMPDIELLNAASKPEIYTLKGGLNLYSSGLIMWSNPAIYSFSCSLELHNFPFDTQKCTMKFSSWIYDNKQIYIKPYNEESKRIDVLNSFSHSEWEIFNVSYNHYNYTKDCCVGLKYSQIDYILELKRFSHYYKLSMGMTISLVIVSFIIMLIKPDNISRTGTAVFIPLTILALQLTIADKIPVVGYYTLMDYFFLTCFISSMIVSIESGLVYSIITSKDILLYIIFSKFVDIEKLYIQEQNKNYNLKNRFKKHEKQITNIKTKNKSYETEFDNVIEQLNNISLTITDNDSTLNNRTTSYLEYVKNENENYNIENQNKNTYSDNLVKTIDYDDPVLELSDKQILVFNKITKIFVFIDNIFRIFMPIIFVIIISIVMDYEK